MLYSIRAKQPEENCCTWRIFHETTPSDSLFRGARSAGRGLRRWRYQEGFERLGRRRRRQVDLEGRLGRPDHADAPELRGHEEAVPEAGNRRARDPEDQRDAVPD